MTPAQRIVTRTDLGAADEILGHSLGLRELLPVPGDQAWTRLTVDYAVFPFALPDAGIVAVEGELYLHELDGQKLRLL